jgi:hypothetical protein
VESVKMGLKNEVVDYVSDLGWEIEEPDLLL